jgi:hypothetical protein
MATKTLGTAATTSLVAVQWTQALADADIATMAQGIIDDKYGSSRIFPGAFTRSGFLYVPNRGSLMLTVGDWIAKDAATGWPILLSAAAAAGAQWVHS